MPESYKPMPAVLDRQIENEAQDAFGHRHFSQALQSLIEADHHKPPFSIGLLGGWGTGKSSIKELYTQGLADGASDGSGKISRRSRIKSITFNAWRFGGKDQDIKRALLRHVFIELGGDEQALHDKLFRNITQVEHQWKGFREYACQLWRAWSMPLPAFLVAILLLFGVLWVGLTVLPWSDPYVRSTFILAISGAYSYLLKNLKPSKVDSFRSITKVSLPSASAEQYEEMLLEQLKAFKEPSGIFRKVNPCERLVIFVDDLDRLSAEEMVLGLDAVRAFMEIPSEKLPHGLGLVFVISCDEAKVADALARGRGKNPEQPGTVFTHMDARRYLDRIFQFRLEIPPVPRGDMRQFALKNLLSFTEIVSDLKTSGTSPEQVIDRMIHVNVADPRNALQIVNAFAQSWWLAKRREYEGSAGERPGGLHEGSVTAHPISLGALSAARVSFPDFYRDLQDDPLLLGRLTQLLVNEGSLLDQPVEAQALLGKRYVTLDKDTKTTTIRDDCRELRQFLSSLVGIRWPDSLQSLLLLSEDPISRKFGAGTSVIYNLLMSGDTRGVVEQLSTRADNVVLSDDHAHLLHELVSDLHLETTARRHNAMRVIANLLDRLPPRTVRLMLGKLCNELTASLDLRSMIGLDKIGNVVKSANAQEQRQIAAELVDDLLSTSQTIEFRLETMQTPSLDEARGMVSKACNIVLSVRAAHGLPAPQERKLIDWLKVRDVNLSGGSYQFEFQELERWIDDHEAMLLTMLGTDYVTLVADELDANRGEVMKLPAVAARVDRLFAELVSQGEESRSILWPLVLRYLALPRIELQACALTVLETSHQRADAQTLSGCVIAVAKNLVAHPKPEIDYRRGFQWTMAVASARFGELTTDAQSNLVLLCNNLSTGESYQTDAVALFELMLQRAPELTAQVSTNWVERLADELPIECCRSLMKAFDKLPDAVQVQITTYFDSGFTAPMPEGFGEIYTMASEEIPSQCWATGNLQAHLDRALSRLPSFVSRSTDDLDSVMVGLSKIYLYGSPATIAACLRDTFSSAGSYPAQNNQLHQHFARTWPSVDQVHPGYVPDTIFTEAISTGRRDLKAAKRGLLASLDSMITAKRVPAEREAELLEFACQVWQTHPAEAEHFFTCAARRLSPSQIVLLPTPISWDSEQEVALLAAAWKKAVSVLNLPQSVASTLEVLALGHTGTVDAPDQVLSLWSKCLDKTAYQVLAQTILTVEATDDGRRRLWRQITSLDPMPAPQELIDLGIRILALGSAPEAASVVNDNLESFCVRLANQESKLATAHTFLRTLPRCSSIKIKTNLARLSYSLGTHAALASVDASTLSEGDMQIISDAFGKGRELTKLKSRFEKASEE